MPKGIPEVSGFWPMVLFSPEAAEAVAQAALDSGLTVNQIGKGDLIRTIAGTATIVPPEKTGLELTGPAENFPGFWNAWDDLPLEHKF